MNIEIDEACKDEQTKNNVINSNNDKFTTTYSRSRATLIINGKLVTTKYVSQIKDAAMPKGHIIVLP